MLLFYFNDEPDIFSIFPIFFIIIGLVIIFIVMTKIVEWAKNNASPILTVPARVVTKRIKAYSGTETSGSTSYFTTFEVQSGDRIELKLSGREYGQLADGDFGLLTFQGTRFHTFERHQKESSD